MNTKDVLLLIQSYPYEGGEGSGNFGHAGRPGEVGGSAPEGEGGGEERTTYSDQTLQAAHQDALPIAKKINDVIGENGELKMTSPRSGEIVYKTENGTVLGKLGIYKSYKTGKWECTGEEPGALEGVSDKLAGMSHESVSGLKQQIDNIIGKKSEHVEQNDDTGMLYYKSPSGKKLALVIIGKHDDGKWHYESDRSLFGFFQNQLRNL